VRLVQSEEVSQMAIETWKHKETGKIVRATPWWEIPEDFVEELGIAEAIADKKDEWKDRKYKIGALVQVGWLLENEHGVWFGVGPKAKEAFDEVRNEGTKGSGSKDNQTAR
jgi:hypothetical protein